MKIVELSNAQFDEFAKYHPLNSYCQTSKYAILMSEYGYSYDYIGMIDESSTIRAAALILIKKIAGHIIYGYAPKGFLVNYYDMALVKEFIELIRQHYKEKDFAFIKFNPEIIIGETDKVRKYALAYNGNVRIIDDLKSLNIKRRAELQEFELLQPKYNAYLNLKKFDLNNLNRNYRKKINYAKKIGMELVSGNAKEIEIFYKFLKNKTVKPLSFFRNMYNIYNRDNTIDLVFVKIDFQKYLSYIKEEFEKESLRNEEFNKRIQTNPKRKSLNRKIDSDKKLHALKEDIIKATDDLKKHQTEYIAGAIVIKHYNRVFVLSSGYSEEYKYLNPNHFLYYSIIERYKEYYNFMDMNGVSGIYDESAKYHGLNQFKLDFKPTIYEFIGEFDLVCNEWQFKKVIKTSYIEDEFNKQD